MIVPRRIEFKLKGQRKGWMERTERSSSGLKGVEATFRRGPTPTLSHSHSHSFSPGFSNHYFLLDRPDQSPFPSASSSTRA